MRRATIAPDVVDGGEPNMPLATRRRLWEK
jgi:hypothetical protein